MDAQHIATRLVKPRQQQYFGAGPNTAKCLADTWLEYQPRFGRAFIALQRRRRAVHEHGLDSADRP
jgi:hypothetical protein